MKIVIMPLEKEGIDRREESPVSNAGLDATEEIDYDADDPNCSQAEAAGSAGEEDATQASANVHLQGDGAE